MGLGEWQGISGEGFDRSNLDLPGNQEQLLEAVAAVGKPVVLVLENGRPLTIGWAAKTYSGHSRSLVSGVSLEDRLLPKPFSAQNNPSGHLTITFPRSTGQLPDFYNYEPSRMHKYVDDDGTPLFPFGFGLSYTTFRYDHLSVHAPAAGSRGDLQVTAEITNTGDTKGMTLFNFICARTSAASKLPIAH